METLKGLKESVCISHIKTGTIIFHAIDGLALLFFGGE
jgi:hypothetical protein